MFYQTDPESNYLAQIVKLGNPIEHPNAERLEGFIINGNTVWYGKGLLTPGELVVYFPVECQIHGEILSNLNLFSDKTLNRDVEKSGLFGSQCRVKAVRLRGQPSEGFIIPIEQFITALVPSNQSIDFNKFRENALTYIKDGLTFDIVDRVCVESHGIQICKKYIPNVSGKTNTSSNISKVPRGEKLKDFLVPSQFRFHESTPKLNQNLHLFNENSIIAITYKLHGTSAVFANVLTRKKLTWKDKLTKWFGIHVVDTEYSRLYSSRSVLKHIENKFKTNSQGYYNNDIWGKCFEDIKDKISPGITLYGEIVGYSDFSKMIQKQYDYGCEPGSYEFYVYRITYTTPDCDVLEFSWDQVKQYCENTNLKYVPQLFHGTVRDFVSKNRKEEYNIVDLFPKILKNAYLEKQCYMCNNNVPAEGVVVRNESRNGKVFKFKSFAFLERETKALDNNEIDIETEQSQSSAENE